jgi:hypothetical protein
MCQGKQRVSCQVHIHVGVIFRTFLDTVFLVRRQLLVFQFASGELDARRTTHRASDHVAAAPGGGGLGTWPEVGNLLFVLN